MSFIPTFTFAGGEISPPLWGRVDLQKYQTGVAMAKNCHIGVEGGLYKRVGQYFIGYPKFQDKEAVLVPWRIANDDSYVLEIGDEYIRFIRLGGHVLYPAGPFTPDPDSVAINSSGFLEVPTEYTEDEVKTLKFTFANDICYIFHKNHPPRQLKRLGLYDWSLVDTDFNPNPAAPTGVTAVWQQYTGSPKSWTNVVSDDPVSGYQEVKKPLKYKVSAIMEDTEIETLPSDQVVVQGDIGNNRLSVKITWSAVTGAKKYHIYKGDNGLFGWIGTILSTETLEFRDTNFAPSYDIVPIVEFEGFDTPDLSNQQPRVGEFYKQRMVYAATAAEQQKLWISRPLFFNDLSTSEPSLPNDAIILELVGNERHTIQHMIQLKKFIIFTDSAEWILGTTNNDALALDTADPVIESKYGSVDYLQPLAVGDRVLFVQSITQSVLDMGYDFATNAYKADDLTRLARHLFENKNIISWEYSLHPNSVAWTVLDDGLLASMTYVRDHEIWGWCRHYTIGNYFDVACVPETDQNASYFQVTREIDGVLTRFIERSEVKFTDRVEKMFYVDCGLTYENELAYTAGTRLAADSFRFTKASHGLAVTDEVLVECDAFHYRCVVTVVAGNNVTVEPKYTDQEFPEEGDFTTGVFLECLSTLTGFDHLAGHSTDLIALADGNVIENISVDGSGNIVLPYKAARVHAGFRYDAEIHTLNMDPDQVKGQYLLKSIDSIKLHLQQSRGILAGPLDSAHDPVPLKPRNDEDMDKPNTLLEGVYEIEAYSEWGLTGAVRILMPYPLPAYVRNIIPDMKYEG